MQNLQNINIYYGLTRSCKPNAFYPNGLSPGLQVVPGPRSVSLMASLVSRALWSTRPHCFPAPAPRHGSASRPPAPDRTPRDAVRGHVAPTAARGDLVPVLRSLLLLSLKTPLFAASPLYLSLSSSLPTLPPRGSRRRQRLRRRSRKLQPSPASSRRRPGNKSCSACSLPSSSVDLGSREVSDSGKGGS